MVQFESGSVGSDGLHDLELRAALVARPDLRFLHGEELAAVATISGALGRLKHRLLGSADDAACRVVDGAAAWATDLSELAALHLARHDAALGVRADEITLVGGRTVRVGADRASGGVQTSTLAQVAGVRCGAAGVGSLLLLLTSGHGRRAGRSRVLRAFWVHPAAHLSEGGAAGGAPTSRRGSKRDVLPCGHSAPVGLCLRVLPFVLGAKPLLHSKVLQLCVVGGAIGHAVRVATVEVGCRLLDLVADGGLLRGCSVQLFKL